MIKIPAYPHDEVFNRRSRAAMARLHDCIAREIEIFADALSNLKRLMKPGRSALLVFDRTGSLQRFLKDVAGCGGRMLKTHADLEHAHVIQSTLRSI